MKKPFLVMLVVLCLAVSFVSAVPDQSVNCGWGIGICNENEVEDELNELVDDINEDFDNVDGRIDDIDGKIDGVDTDSQDRDTIINQYINDNSGKWAEDKGGMSRNALAHYLTGLWNMDWIFKGDMNYFEWLKDFFVQKDTYETKITELEARLDEQEATIKKLLEATGTKPANEFEVAMVTSARTGEIIEVNGFKCDSNMEDCTKVFEAPPSEQDLATAAATEEEEAKTKAQQEWDDELEWHTRICERLHVKWHCDAMEEMLAE